MSPPNVYRDELNAALSRVKSLKTSLATAESRVLELKESTTHQGVSESAGISFVRAETLWPLWHLWFDGLTTSLNSFPKRSPSRPDSVVLALLERFVMPSLTHLLRALYFTNLLFVALWTVLLTLLISVVVLPVALLSCVRFEGSQPPSWLRRQGNGSDYLFILLSMFGQPLLPLYTIGWKP